MTALAEHHTIPASEWQAVAAESLERARRFTLPARERHTAHQPDPIEDFLFGYYPFPLSILEKWHPGVGVVLERSEENPPHLLGKHYRVTDDSIQADPSTLTDKQRRRLGYMIELLEATRDRAPNFACHGLHEWAMVYRGRDIRHEKTLTLRLPQAQIDALVESRPLCCSHHDAFRFFAKEARPMNLQQPTLETRAHHEQPACLHANMDLYKWAAKAMPWVGSVLLFDCFELALELRNLDMRASPYDLRPW
ncbi:MAG: hypothetical protein R3242_10280, partial [Akkermansiaceae bacterium]|nr:hypothetical protein [Akkermansiaceae bacterium]